METIQIISFLFLFMLMLGLGVAVNVTNFRDHLYKPKGLVTGVLCQFVIMPPLAYFISGIMKVHNVYRIAQVLVACCPGGAMSNIICFLIGADLDLSVAMTAVSSFCSIFMMPLNIYIYVNLLGLCDDVNIDYTGIVVSAVLVVAGLICGVFAKKQASLNEERGPVVLKFLTRVGALGGIGTFVISVINSAKSETPLWRAPPMILGAASVQVLCGIFLGFAFSKLVGLKSSSCVSVSIEVSVQNAILAIAIITISYDENDAAKATIFPLCYMFFSTWMNLIWGFLSWKVFGFTDIPQSISCSDIWTLCRSTMAVGILNEGGGEGSAQQWH